MKNLSNYFLNNFIRLKNKLRPEINKAFKGIANQSEKVAALSKNKIELERARLELKRKYKELGIYIFNQYDANKVSNFSKDVSYVKLLNDLKNSKLLINRISEERKKIRSG